MSKGLKHICILICAILTISIISACGYINETKNSYKKNTELNEELPYYTIDEEDHSKISYGNEIYMITENIIEKSNLSDDPIGQISKTFKNINGKDLRYGYVYGVSGEKNTEIIAVNINNEFKEARINE